MEFSLGLPWVSITKTPNLYSFQNAKQRYTRLFCQFTVHLTKSAIEGILKAQQNREGYYRYCHGISLWQKYDVCLNFQNAKNGIPLISQPDYGTSASLRYIQRQQNQEGDTDVQFTVTVYRFMAKKLEVFQLSWF